MQFGGEIFTKSPVPYMTVYFKKLVSNLSYAGSSFVGSESIKRKMRLSESPSKQKHFYIADTKSLWGQYKLVSEGKKQTTESTKQ